MRFLILPLLGSAILLQTGCKDEKDVLAEVQREAAQKAAQKEADIIAVATRSAQLEELKFRETLRKERLIQIEATKKLIAELETRPKEEAVQTNREILKEIGLWDGSEFQWTAFSFSRDDTMARLNSAAEKYRRDKSAERRKALEERTKELEFARSRLVQLLSLVDDEPKHGNAGKGK
jgi:hypothetical protein